MVTLLVIIDPIGNAPVFVSLTARLAPRDARWAAVRAVGAAALLILGFALFGQFVLSYLHVSLSSLSIAGGLLLLLVALEMLGGTGALHTDDNIVLVPLATPLLAGPGAIAAVMVLVRAHPGASGRAAVLLGILVAVVAVGAVLLAAHALARLVPVSVIAFLTRVLGLLLAAIGVQLVVDGVQQIVRANR